MELRLKNKKQRLLRDLISLCSGEAVGKIAGFVAFAYLARTLGPESYGLVELAVAISVIFMLLINFGYGSIGAREISKDPSTIRSFIAKIVTARLFLAFLIIPIMGLTGYLIAKIPATSNLIWWYAIALFAIPWDHSWLLQGMERMRSVAIGQVIRMGGFAIGVIILVHEADDYWLVGVVEVLASFSMAAYFIIIQLRHVGRVGLELRIRPLFDLSKQAAFIGLSNAVWAVSLYAPTLFIGAWGNVEQLAWFGAAHRIVTSFIAFSLIYHFNLFPSVSKQVAKSSGEFKNLANPSIKVAAWFGIGTALAVLLVSVQLSELIFGSKFIQTAKVLNILIWALPITLLSGHARWALIAAGHQRCVFYAQVCGLIVTIILCWVLVPLYQATGGAIAMVVSTLAVWTVAHFSARRYICKISFIEETFRPMLIVLLSLYSYSLFNNPWLAFISALIIYTIGAFLIDWKLPEDIRTFISIKDGKFQSFEIVNRELNIRIKILIISVILIFGIFQIPQISIPQWLNSSAKEINLFITSVLSN